MESSQEVAVALPSPSPAEDEREYDFMNVRPDIIVSVMEKNEWNMLDVVDPISGPIVKALTSSLFYPQSHLVPSPPDVVLKSSDAVLFYVHESVLNGASSNAFGALVNAGHSGGIKAVDENRDVLSVILRAQYDIISAAAYDPSLSTLVTAVDRFPRYGLSPSAFVTPTSAIYSLLSAYAPTHPRRLLASAHLASFPLEQSTDETTKPMGEAYMARLVLSISVGN
ncbi:hypothetical protein BDZ89DRAFT_1066980 [Hymenopellis radicata]|nr:hypothetical protein BDZ89DRAFT_1066980 [Hymenopellis radicata]